MKKKNKHIVLYPIFEYNEGRPHEQQVRIDIEGIKKQLRRTPEEVIVRLRQWIKIVEKYGLSEVRKVKGYHDEPLKGARQGQRSIRLGKKWRAIYIEKINYEIHLILIKELTPHDYRTK